LAIQTECGFSSKADSDSKWTCSDENFNFVTKIAPMKTWNTCVQKIYNRQPEKLEQLVVNGEIP